MFKPRLLRETAEIALTEIKRFIEPRLTEDFSLRRVSAPLFLPVDSGLNDPGKALRFHLPHSGEEVEIVRGLNRWLRSQLVRYDIAPGFGVFTVMNALQLDVEETATSSPHIAAWSWQQVIEPDQATADYLTQTSRRLYTLMRECEQMILERFPHLEATLPQRFLTISRDEILSRYPSTTPLRGEYQLMHDTPDRAILILDTPSGTGRIPSGNPPSVNPPSVKEANPSSSGSNNPRSVNEANSSSYGVIAGQIMVWNKAVKRPLCICEIAADTNAPVCSIGGTILRDQLAMQILHQLTLLR